MTSRHLSAPARIAAVGMYVPQRVLTNADFERMFDTITPRRRIMRIRALRRCCSCITNCRIATAVLFGVRSEINGQVDKSRLLRQNGREVYRWVIEAIPADIERVLRRADLVLEEIDWFVPHSANLRMIEALDKRIGFPIERNDTARTGSRAA
jgi:3-oxoacyl-[acyl-carrier-protein] synthase III